MAGVLGKETRYYICHSFFVLFFFRSKSIEIIFTIYNSTYVVLPTLAIETN